MRIFQYRSSCLFYIPVNTYDRWGEVSIYLFLNLMQSIVFLIILFLHNKERSSLRDLLPPCCMLSSHSGRMGINEWSSSQRYPSLGKVRKWGRVFKVGISSHMLRLFGIPSVKTCARTVSPLCKNPFEAGITTGITPLPIHLQRCSRLYFDINLLRP